MKYFNQFVNESKGNLFDRTFKAFQEETEDLSRIPNNELFGGLIAKVLRKVGINDNPIPEEFENATYEFLMDFIFGGVEPEDLEPGEKTADEVLASYMEVFKHIKYVPGDKFSPYKDKTIPYLKYK